MIHPTVEIGQKPEPTDDGPLPSVLAALRDIIAAAPGRDGAELAAARVLLAVHARELAALVQQRIDQDRAADTSDGKNRYAHHRRGGMTTALQILHRYADQLDTQAAGGEDR